uniref:Uncharacterized protein n=1 Tax=Romanomermis culicivorax TaxID=13658 RepID=A0A915KMN1_ROMCU
MFDIFGVHIGRVLGLSLGLGLGLCSSLALGGGRKIVEKSKICILQTICLFEKDQDKVTKRREYFDKGNEEM